MSVERVHMLLYGPDIADRHLRWAGRDERIHSSPSAFGVTGFSRNACKRTFGSKRKLLADFKAQRK